MGVVFWLILLSVKMPQLGPRIARLEKSRPAGGAVWDMSQLDQATLDAMAEAYAASLRAPSDPSLVDLLNRVALIKAKERGLGDLATSELEAIVAWGDVAQGRA